MRFVGDVHGRFDDLLTKLKGCDKSIQVGDMGVGFFGYEDFPLVLPPGHKFIRGNHDNPGVCRKHPNYLGDFGFLKDLSLFYLSGAYSIDHARRMPEISWWWEEELSYGQMQEAIDQYLKSDARIVVSHDCPQTVLPNLVSWPVQNRTSSGLQCLLEARAPEIWIFGHHHKSLDKKIGKTRFICLDELEAMDLDL